MLNANMKNKDVSDINMTLAMYAADINKTLAMYAAELGRWLRILLTGWPFLKEKFFRIFGEIK